MLPLADNTLIQPIPGLMIWTIICFAITFFILRQFAFGPIQRIIDERRERILRSLQEADNARDEARRLLEEHKALLGKARSQAEDILIEARRVAESHRGRARRNVAPQADRQRDQGPRLLEAGTGGGPIAVAHRIYARALFDAAKEKNSLREVHEELADFVQAARD